MSWLLGSAHRTLFWNKTGILNIRSHNMLIISIKYDKQLLNIILPRWIFNMLENNLHFVVFELVVKEVHFRHNVNQV